MVNCQVCGRILKNPKAAAKGIGPVCEQKHSYRLEELKKEKDAEQDINSNPENRKELQASMDTKLPELSGKKE